MSFDYRDKPKETKKTSERAAKWVYWTTFLGASLVLWGLPFLVLPMELAIGWFFLFQISGVYFADFFARSACEFAGISQAESRQETIERSAGAALAPFLSEAPEFDLGRAQKPRTRVDRDSISGYSSGSKWMRIEWRDVGSCVVATRRDVFGNPSYCHIRLEGHQKFHTIFQAQLSHADAEKLLPAIRFYLRGEESALQVLGGS
jgi:hypothetical protein